MARHKQDIFGVRLDTPHRNFDTSWRFSIGRMRGILDPAASAVNKSNNENPNAFFKRPSEHSLQLRVLGFGLLQDGDVGVCVFPEGEEILIGGLCLGSVGFHRIGAGEPETRHCKE
jgi:hypothetical protein